LCRFEDVTGVEAVLDHLAQREDGPYVLRLAREPGKRESRYAHLFSGELIGQTSYADEHESTAGLGESGEHPHAARGRLSLLEQRVAELEAEVAALKKLVADPNTP
jgi:hypothetical protein